MTFEADDDETPELLSNKRSSGKSSFRALKSALGTEINKSKIVFKLLIIRTIKLGKREKVDTLYY